MVSPSPAQASLAPDALPQRTKYLIFAVMAFGQFMALIDIQIVAASLNDVQAGLSAGPDEISWVQTAYLMAELVMIPFSAFLAQALSTRVLFALSAGLFTISSALCGLASDIGSMIAFRAVQGFVGGAMVPTVFATGYALFTGKDRAMIPAILGMVSVLAPTLGPTVGGWITDAINWRWIFYINVVPGIAVTVLSLLVIRHVDKPNLSMLQRIDYSHLAALAVMLGGVEYVLEEGQRHDWLTDPGIAIAAWASFVAFLLFLERAFRSGGPIVRLSPLRKPTFAMACVFNLVLGFGTYASNYLIPVYLGRVRDYDSLQIGGTVFVTGIAQLASVPVASRLSQRLDSRIMIAIGLPLFAVSQWISSYITPDWGFWEWLAPQAVRGFSLMLCVVPSVTMALGGFAGPELRYASGLFNLMRNLGGAIGISLVNVWLYDQTRIHAERLSEAMDVTGRPAGAVLADLARQMQRVTPDPNHALALARGELSHLFGRATLALGFDEVFRLIACLFLASLVMVPFCKPPKPGAQPSADAH